MLGEITGRTSGPANQCLKRLLLSEWTSDNILEATFQLARRLGEQSVIRKAQHKACLYFAGKRDANALLARLVERYRETSLSKDDLQEVLTRFLEKSSFEDHIPWKAFFSQLPEAQIPRMHKVYAALERWKEASDLAEADRDYRSATQYLRFVPGAEAALRAVSLAQNLGDPRAIHEANARAAEEFWRTQRYAEALIYFQKTDQLERVSDCQQQLGRLAEAIQARPSITPEWMSMIRSEVEAKVHLHLQQQQFIEAVRLLRAVEASWQTKRDDPPAQAEAARTHRLMSEALRTARTALETEMRSTQVQPGAEIYKRWSHLEEAVGNYLEAGLQAELAQDFFAAAILFEKAGAFGQALSALGQTVEGVAPARRAELLERGGDFFMAGLLYERMGEIEKAVHLYEQASEFGRAAELWRKGIGDDKSAFDGRYLALLAKAGRVEQLAQLCDAKASDPSLSPEARAGFLRRIKELGDKGLIERRWTDRIATRLAETEASEKGLFDEEVGTWAETATREVLATYLDVFGLDLGTSNSVIALYNKKAEQPEVVESGGRQLIPSVLVIDQTGRETVGVRDSELMGKSLRAVITKAKRAMGTETKFKAGDQLFRPEEIAARVIGHARNLGCEFLVRKIEAHIHSAGSRAMSKPPSEQWVTDWLEKHPPEIHLDTAVITVPAYFNDSQKQATRTAANLAGIGVLRLIHEPTAAALAQYSRGAKTETLLIVDLGAGTLDLSLMEVADGVFQVKEIEGDNRLGSSDLDELLFSHFAAKIKQETGLEIASSNLASRRLRQACEHLKIELSSQSSWTIELPHLLESHTIRIALTRDEFENTASTFLERIRVACRKIKTKPSRLLLIGGGAQMPAVRRCVKDVFGLEPSPGLDPLTAVARGAAIQAAILKGARRETLVLDATPFSLGIKSWTDHDEVKFSVLIPKHTPIPAKKADIYTTAHDNQSAVRVEVFQGESERPEQNFKIGQFILDGILPAKAQQPQIEVSFGIDANCLLVVAARDLATGRQCQIKIADSHLLTPAQVSSLQERLQASRSHQERMLRLEKAAAGLTSLLRESDNLHPATLQTRFQDSLRHYEASMSQYVPTHQDNETMLDIYRQRGECEAALRLATDRRDALRKSIDSWLHRCGVIESPASNGENRLEGLLNEGESLLRRACEVNSAVKAVAQTYQRWISVITGLPVNPEGKPEDIATHFLRLSRYDEAFAHFKRLSPPLAPNQVEMGLEILARQRRRDDYTKLLGQHSGLLGVHAPDFLRINQSVRLYTSSVSWIQVDLGGGSFATGSGFFIGANQVATNRHVVANDKTNGAIPAGSIRVISRNGIHQVASVHLPSQGRDDVAILQLESEPPSITPLRLGFSELVEVGERILTIGFPSARQGGFSENLFCNAGLVNRIRPSESCSERVLEVSIELRGGISGSPILNELGEVVGLVTFTEVRQEVLKGGGVNFERSFFAVPVEILRRLRAERC
jgi:molecular chaperone DnaK